MKASDQSVNQPFFPLTKTGEPICLNEHAVHIAATPSTQVILLEDWQSETAGEPDSAVYVDPQAEFQELRLESRPGRQRLHYFE